MHAYMQFVDICTYFQAFIAPALHNTHATQGPLDKKRTRSSNDGSFAYCA